MAGQFIIDISTHISEFGEFVEFATLGETTNVRGRIVQGNVTTNSVPAAVFPEGFQKLEFDTDGVNLKGAKVVYCETYFPISDDDEDPQDTRMRYNGKTYRLVARQPYPGNYYIYIAEWMRIKPDAFT